MKESKLSELKEGDCFYFKNNVIAKYIVGSYSLQDLETKEFSKVPNKKNNIPKDMQTFGITEKGWKKSFDHSWDYLDTVLSDLEMRVVLKLCRMAEMNTNSLKPLSDETTQIEISETFNIDRRKAKIMFEKLYNYSTEKEFGKWLLSKFYLYSKMDY